MSLNVLCFGDSLTEGYSQWGSKFTPYGKTLESFLRDHLSEPYDIKVRIEGVSGERVVGSMLERMERLCKFAFPT